MATGGFAVLLSVGERYGGVEVHGIEDGDVRKPVDGHGLVAVLLLERGVKKLETGPGRKVVEKGLAFLQQKSLLIDFLAYDRARLISRFHYDIHNARDTIAAVGPRAGGLVQQAASDHNDDRELGK